MLADILPPPGPVETVAPELIVVMAALGIGSIADVDIAIVVTTAALEAELVIIEGVAVMSNVLCVGGTALLLFAQIENTEVPFDLDTGVQLSE